MPQPDGNPFRAALERQQEPAEENPFRAAQKGAGKTFSANYVAREIGARKAADNIMAVPSAGGELLANALNFGAAGVERAAIAGGRNAKRLVGAELDPNPPSLGDLYDRNTQSEGFVRSMLRSIPRPTTRGVVQTLGAVPALMPGGETPGQAYERKGGEYDAEEANMRAQHPTAATIGDVGGDVASLLIGRRASGADRFVQRVETRLAGHASAKAAESLAGDLGKILKGPAMQRLARGGARSLESGAEAAALDILKDPNADPTETAALAAGGQLVGSGALATAKGLVSGGWGPAGLKLSVAAISTAGMLQVLKSSAPGGRDRVLESIESGYDKVALALAVGVASAAIGATRYGRGNTPFWSEQSRAMLDGIGTLHRGAVLSVLSDWTEGDEKQQGQIEHVLTALSKDPGFRGDNPYERALVSRLGEASVPDLPASPPPRPALIPSLANGLY